jgi:hypothetical protein
VRDAVLCLERRLVAGDVCVGIRCCTFGRARHDGIDCMLMFAASGAGTDRWLVQPACAAIPQRLPVS